LKPASQDESQADLCSTMEGHLCLVLVNAVIIIPETSSVSVHILETFMLSSSLSMTMTVPTTTCQAVRIPALHSGPSSLCPYFLSPDCVYFITNLGTLAACVYQRNKYRVITLSDNDQLPLPVGTFITLM
jgi:hypothetical protein